MANRQEDLKLKDTKFDNKGGAILGVLEGPVADIVDSTRNGRKYTESLWKKVFANPLVQEMFNNGGVVGELDHPADRQEICSEKIAVIMPEPPVKDKDGTLVGRFNILDTPCGRIVYTLAKAGFKVGVSSRGSGDVYTGDDGEEYVDEDTYDFTCFDVVLVPAVEKARMTLVTESLDQHKVSLRKALNEALSNSSETDRKIMTETLDNLGIDYKERKVKKSSAKLIDSETTIQEGTNTSISESIDEQEGKFSKQTIEKTNEANDDGSDEMLKSLQEALRNQVALTNQIQDLQSKLAVSDTKVDELTEELGKYKDAHKSISMSAKTLKGKVSALEEELKVKEKTIKAQSDRIKKLAESKNKVSNSVTQSLNESISKKDNEIAKLTENYNSLNETLAKQKAEYEKQIGELNESITTLTSDAELLTKQYSEKLNKSIKLKESYKKLAHNTVSRYIDSKATMLGITSNEIRNRLPESYTIDDIDKICEDLQNYNLNISKLPFNLNNNKVKVQVKESKNESLKLDSGIDDDVDDSLLSMAKLK